MPELCTPSDIRMSDKQIQAALHDVRLSQQEFQELIYEGWLLERHTSLVRLVEVLRTLRLKNLETSRSVPSKLELLYGLSLDEGHRILELQTRRQCFASARVLIDPHQPPMLRFLAYKRLLKHELHGLKQQSRAYNLVWQIKNGFYHREGFALLMAAQVDPCLAPEMRAEARRMAAIIFRDAMRSDFGFDPEEHVDKHLSDTEEAAFERWFDSVFGRGMYTDLMFCIS